MSICLTAHVLEIFNLEFFFTVMTNCLAEFPVSVLCQCSLYVLFLTSLERSIRTTALDVGHADIDLRTDLYLIDNVVAVASLFSLDHVIIVT